MKLRRNLYLTLFIISISIPFLYGCSGASPEYRTYQNLLRNQMQDMINVLNAGHYNEFMNTYVEPAYLTKEGGVDKALLKFDNKEQQQLYIDLKNAKNVSPLYDEKTKEMTYIGENLVNPITFRFNNGKWYMEGSWFK